MGLINNGPQSYKNTPLIHSRTSSRIGGFFFSKFGLLEGVVGVKTGTISTSLPKTTLSLATVGGVWGGTLTGAGDRRGGLLGVRYIATGRNIVSTVCLSSEYHF